MNPPDLFRGANAKTVFTKGFSIDEERLRRALSIVKESLKEPSTRESIRIRVGRSDGLTYETRNVDDVAREDNFASERIDRISVRSKSDDFELELDFYDGETKLLVEGKDRNTVQVLNSRLRSFLRDDVCSRFGVPSELDRIAIFLAGFVLIFFVALLFWRSAPSESDYNAVIESQSLEQKIDFLIGKQRDDHAIVAGPYFPLMASIMAIGLGLKPICLFFFPRSTFLFGKEIERNEKLVALRGKLAWGIGASFIVSFLSGLSIWFFTK